METNKNVRGSPNPWVTSTKRVTSCDIYFIKKFTVRNINAAIILAIKVADSLTESTPTIPEKSDGIESR